MTDLDREDLTLLIDALAKAAARLECEAHYVKCGARHDEKAKKMRQLRTRLMRHRIEIDAVDSAAA